jgi:hypothetical protein
MKIVFLITALETLVIALWMILRHSRKRRLQVAPLESSFLMEKPRAELHDLDSWDATRWSFINRWRVDDQADDRTPMSGAVAVSSGAPSAYRSFARRSHQLMYKKWSKDRHD